MIKLQNPISESTPRNNTVVPDGKYLVEVVVCDQRTPLKGGQDYLNVELNIVDSAKEDNESAIGLKIFEKLSLSEASRWRLINFLDACCPPKFVGDEIDVEGIWIIVEAKEKEYEGRVSVRCTSFAPSKNWKGVTKTLDSSGEIVSSDKMIDKVEKKDETNKSSSSEVVF